jgi:hypothetical protein
MTQMNDVRATVTAVSVANNTVTLDVDSSAFTAFAFPASAVGYRQNFPQAIRFGNTSQGVLAPTDNVGAFQLQFGSDAVGDSGDTMEVLLLYGVSV